jgi:hypothetical protein
MAARPSQGADAKIATELLVEFNNDLSAEVKERQDQLLRVATILGIPMNDAGGLLIDDAPTQMERFHFSLGVISGQREFFNSLAAFLITWSNDAVGNLRNPPNL